METVSLRQTFVIQGMIVEMEVMKMDAMVSRFEY